MKLPFNTEVGYIYDEKEEKRNLVDIKFGTKDHFKVKPLNINEMTCIPFPARSLMLQTDEFNDN